MSVPPLASGARHRRFGQRVLLLALAAALLVAAVVAVVELAVRR